MKKRIGIITLQKSPVNYGAALQCYALWRYVDMMGYDCEVVDIYRPCHKGYKYSPEFGEKGPGLVRRLKDFVKKILRPDKTFNNRNSLFEDFHKQIRYSIPYKSVRELSKNPPIYDVYLTGSDQVWNPNQPIYNGSYFWEFCKQGGRKVSYASSFSVDYLPEDCRCKYSQWLNEYTDLSVREESGRVLIKSLIGRDSTLCLDPVFLLKQQEWKDLERTYEGIQNHYIFLYLVKLDDKMLEMSKQFAKQINLPLYVVLSQSRLVEDVEVKQFVDVGPYEWLYLIDHADYIMTDSFHGTSFSIIMEKPFLTLVNPEKNTNSRITTLLCSINLESHIISTDSEKPIRADLFDFDVHNATIELNKLIDVSKNYLEDALK